MTISSQQKTFTVKDKIALLLIPNLFKTFFSVIGLTCKTQWHGKEALLSLKNQQQPWIYSTWHNNVSTGAWAIRNQNIGIMISNSKDGEFINRCVEKFGNYGLRGSSSKGAMKATKSALKHLKNGSSIAVTPDGPRGPKHKLQDGVLFLAAASGAPIIPFHIECSRQTVFKKSWDKHKIPRLFSTVNIMIGEPIWVTKEQLKNNPQELRQLVEDAMIKNCKVPSSD